MTMHTSGPWELVEVPDEKMISNWHIKIGNYQVSVFPYRYENSPCGKYGGYLNDPEMTANARLMTAAPDLFEVAHQALAFIGVMPHGDNCFVSSHYEGDPGDRCNCGKDSAIDALDTAINKATGA